MAKKRPAKKQPYRVFISHATSDKWIAIQLDNMIQAMNIETFRDDRNLAAGGPISEEIRQHLRASQELLVLWTPTAKESDWVKAEMAMAFGFELRIVPVRYLTDLASLPPFIQANLSPTLTEADIQKYCEDLKARSQQKKRGRR